MENGNNGFVLSEELTVLREQVKRIIRAEIIPIEDRLDPDAPEIPESEFWPIARRTQAAGLWCMGVQTKYGGGGLGTFDMCVLMEEMAQHRIGLYNPRPGVFGRTPPPDIWTRTQAQIQKSAAPTPNNASYTFFPTTHPSAASSP